MCNTLPSSLLSISYSLPHIIAQSGGAIYVGYVGLLYINIYKWNPDKFGRLYSFYFITTSICELVFSLMFHFVFFSRDENIGLRNCKILQVINISLHCVIKLRYEQKINSLENNICKSEEDTGQNGHVMPWILTDKWFSYLIYFVTFFNAYGWGAYEISDLLIPTYIVRDSTDLFSTSCFIKGLSVFAVPLLINLLTKLFKGKYPDYAPYVGISIILLIFLIPVSVLFFLYTVRHSGGSNVASDLVPETSNLDYPALFGFTILSATVALMFMACPLNIQYISTKFLNNNENFRMNATSLYLTFFFFGSLLHRIITPMIDVPKKIVSFICIACHSVAYLLLFPFRYSWNKNGIIYYVAIAIYNIFIMISFINTNIMITNQLGDDNHKKYRWLIQGIIFVISNMTVSIGMKVMYKIYDEEDKAKISITNECNNNEVTELIPSTKFNLNFRNVFIILYSISQIGNIIGTLLYKEHIFE